MEEQLDKTEAKRQQVEKMGVFFEKSGLTPMHGRVFAFLLLAEPIQKDFYEIQDFLKASKSAISNALKHLQSAGIVDYVTFSGDRRKYFRADLNGWMRSTENRVKETVLFKELLEDVLDGRSATKNLEFNTKLQEMVDFHAELSVVMEQFMKKWNKKRATNI